MTVCCGGTSRCSFSSRCWPTRERGLTSDDVTPHVASKIRYSALDGRTTRHATYQVSQRLPKRVSEIFGGHRNSFQNELLQVVLEAASSLWPLSQTRGGFLRAQGSHGSPRQSLKKTESAPSFPLPYRL